MHKLQRLLRAAVIATTASAGAFTTLIAATPATEASASCTTSPMEGTWRNVDVNTRSITRVVVTLRCGPIYGGDDEIGTVSYGASYDISVFGKCSPTDCSWGTRRLSRAADGWYRTNYQFGFKWSDVWIKLIPTGGGTYQLRVWIYNDFTAADGRTDYVTDERFVI